MLLKKEPFFSIVIANYNYGNFLPATLDSILSQDMDDYEIIIIDGGSSDNSRDVIKKYQQHISWWVSEPDNGQTNAFNKGFSKAKGKFLTWLNADDILLPGSLKKVKETLTKNPEYEWATGNLVRFLQENGKIIDSRWGPNYLPKWLQGDGKVIVVNGPTSFWSRKIFNNVGPLDEKLHYIMDTEYWRRLNHYGYKQIRINHTCWGFRMHEYSKTAEYNDHLLNKEVRSKIIKEEKYVDNKYNYKLLKKWYYIGLFMRVIDLSLIKTFFNKLFINGKDIRKVFHINYNIKTTK